MFFLYLEKMLEQKEQEYRTFNLFRDLLPNFPNGRIVQNESPDFLVRMNARKTIGIELTELRGQDFYDRQGQYSHPEAIKEQIETTIRAKEDKIYLYQKSKPYQLWLLIHLESFNNKIRYNFKDKIERWSFSAAFDRVFLLEIQTQKLLEII